MNTLFRNLHLVEEAVLECSPAEAHVGRKQGAQGARRVLL